MAVASLGGSRFKPAAARSITPAVRPAIGIALALVLLVTVPAESAPEDRRLAAVSSWAFAIGDGALHPGVAARWGAYDLVVVDGEEVTAKQVAGLHRAGALVLGYVSVGTIEKGRGWAASARPYRLEHWDDWDEWFADVAQPGFRDLMAGEVAPEMLAKGLDGLFLDNTDMVEDHPEQRLGMIELVRRLAVEHPQQLLFTQNGESLLEPLVPHLDGWNREDVSSTYDFERERYARVPAAEVRRVQATLRDLGSRGLLVTATDYTAAGDGRSARNAVRRACAAGALPYVGDIELTRRPARPYRCARRGAAGRP